ncbi:S-layer homology domain-containing protein [Paenibacillus spongiae]|uniref:S-layer homology domain-containing protein n=1 Tax=Paenibacillus spongiae TaxID=2909671 RepID=A0ABY5SLX0_9BACL|nr:S-layer homology domain-containing protein [Paenibacillus spongiae]UVI33223.1 S-layer homology domain-containing protein [Paenibacillus spongiae]
MNWIRTTVSAIVSLCLAGSILQPVSAGSASPFNDISGSFAKKEIIRLYEKNIITGTTATTFSPTKPISRAEFVTILNRLLGLQYVNSSLSSFTDVSKNAWYYGWIQAAVQLGLAEGISASKFAPEKQVTRQEAAVLIIRAMKQSAADNTHAADFVDTSLIAAWAEPSVASAQRLGLVKGDDNGRFHPKAPITRQETAVMIDRVLQNDKWAAALKSKARPKVQLGWQYNQTTEQYERTILQSNVNTLSPRWYFLAESGTITDGTDRSLITWAKKYNKKVWAMVGNRSDARLTHLMLSDSSLRTAAINNLTGLVKKYSLDGLDIDFENVAPEDRSALTAFMKELSVKLHGVGAVLAVNVSPDLGTDWTEAFDYRALGKSADYIILMGYDEHYSGSPQAGSNASLPFVKKGLDRLFAAVPHGKVILGLPLFNKDWTLSSQGEIISTSFMSLLEQNDRIHSISSRLVWDSYLGQYTVNYTQSGFRHSIWVEEGRSLSAKYKLAVDGSAAGFAYWYAGGESPDIWTSLSNADKFFSYVF